MSYVEYFSLNRNGVFDTSEGEDYSERWFELIGKTEI